MIISGSNENVGLSNEMVVMADHYPLMLGFKGEKVFENPSVLYCCFLNIQGVQLNMTMD